GIASLALFFGSHMILGLAGWDEVILLVAGLALLGVEIFVVPGFGIFGVAGTLAVLASLYLSLVGNMATGFDLSQAALILSTAIALVLVGAWTIIRLLPRNERFRRSGIMLGDSLSRETGYLSAPVRPDLVGHEGVALTDLRPAGTAQIGDERVDVVADGSWIERGTPIRVVRSDGYRHVVQPVG